MTKVTSLRPPFFMKFWLIQRGSFNDLKETYTGFTGVDGLINLDYMGSSEFEWGAIPKAYRRIMGRFKDYSYYTIDDIKDYRGIPLIVFCHKDKSEVIKKEIKRFVKEQYGLKGYCNLKDHIKGVDSCSNYTLKQDFFWNIDNEEIGDWMAFFGDDKFKAFKETIENHYNNWWLKKDKETRQREYNKAFDTF